MLLKRIHIGHPNEEILERLNSFSRVYMTKDSGEIRIKILRNGKIYVKECIRN